MRAMISLRVASLLSIAIGPLFLSNAHADTPPCQGSDLQTANTALVSAQQAMDKSISAIGIGDDRLSTLMLTWFGARNSDANVWVELQQITQTLQNSRSFSNGVVFFCSNSTNSTLGDVYAYVQPDNSFAIVLGTFFFNAPDSGFNSKPGTIVHELSHFVLSGATRDTIYGISGAKNLAATNPAAAQKNADNYEYYVEAAAFGL